MRKKSNYRDLMLILNDIEVQTKKSVTYAIFFRKNIQEFKVANKSAVEDFYAGLEAITEKYALMGPDGKPALGQSEGEQAMLFKDEDAKASFQKEYWEFLTKEVWLTT